MKHLFLFIVLTSLVLTACKKKEQPIEPELSAKAGSFLFYASGKTVTTDRSPGGSTSSLEIQGVMASGATLKLWIRNYSGALDSLSLDSTEASATYIPPFPSIEVRSVHGKLYIISATPALKGTFYFTCTDSTLVTGDFKVAP